MGLLHHSMPPLLDLVTTLLVQYLIFVLSFLYSLGHVNGLYCQKHQHRSMPPRYYTRCFAVLLSAVESMGAQPSGGSASWKSCVLENMADPVINKFQWMTKQLDFRCSCTWQAMLTMSCGRREIGPLWQPERLNCT